MASQVNKINMDIWKEHVDGLLAWLQAQAGGGTGLTTSQPWIDVAPATILSPTFAQQFLAFDTSGAQSTCNLPSSVSALDGQIFLIKCTGNMLSPVIVNAGAGTTVELLNAPGTFGAQTWLPIQGQSVVFKYDKATTTWKVWCSYNSGGPGQQSYNPGWYATLANAAWDPAAGIDSNSGAPGSPVQTMAEIARRCGSTDVTMPYGTSVKITKVTAQNANTDSVNMTWRMSGGGQAILVDTLIVKTADFVPGGALTPKNQATGAVLAIGGFPVGTVAGDYVFNVTKDSYANVDVGGATPKFSGPIPAATITTPGIPVLAEDNTWSATDHYIIYTRNLLNLKAWRVIGGDVSAGNVACSGWVQWANIADSSGTAASEYGLVCEGATNVMSGCQILPRVHMAILNGRGNGSYLLGCDVTGAIVNIAGGITLLYGTIARASLSLFDGAMTVDGASILHGAVLIESGFLQWCDAYADGSISLRGGGVCQITTSAGGTAAVWGSATTTLYASGTFSRTTGASWAATFLTSGAINFGGAKTTGTAPSVSGTFVATGAAQVDVAPTGTDHFPANAKISFSMQASGGTPALVFFSAAQIADAFHIASVALNTSTYNWQAFGGTDNLTALNFDKYNGMYDEATGARFCNAA